MRVPLSRWTFFVQETISEPWVAFDSSEFSESPCRPITLVLDEVSEPAKLLHAAAPVAEAAVLAVAPAVPPTVLPTAPAVPPTVEPALLSTPPELDARPEPIPLAVPNASPSLSELDAAAWAEATAWIAKLTGISCPFLRTA